MKLMLPFIIYKEPNPVRCKRATCVHPTTNQLVRGFMKREAAARYGSANAAADCDDFLSYCNWPDVITTISTCHVRVES